MTRSNGGWFKALSSGRRPVKWFLFTDLLLVCQAKAFGGGGGAATYHLKVKMDILDIDIAANAAEDEDEFDEENTGRPSMRREPSSGITQPSRWVAATQMILARGIAANDAPAPSTSAPGPTRGSGKRGSTGWSNVLQQAVGRNETLKEDELYGESEKEALHIIHHGRNGGGVYKAWATSESEARELVKQVTLLQAQLRERTQTLKDRKAAARFKGRHIRRTLGSEYGLNQAGLNE